MPVYSFECPDGHHTEVYFPQSPNVAREAANRGVTCDYCLRPATFVISPFHTEERWKPRKDISTGKFYTTASERDRLHREKGLVYVGREGGA